MGLKFCYFVNILDWNYDDRRISTLCMSAQLNTIEVQRIYCLPSLAQPNKKQYIGYTAWHIWTKSNILDILLGTNEQQASGRRPGSEDPHRFMKYFHISNPIITREYLMTPRAQTHTNAHTHKHTQTHTHTHKHTQKAKKQIVTDKQQFWGWREKYE